MKLTCGTCKAIYYHIVPHETLGGFKTEVKLVRSLRPNDNSP